MSIVLFDKEKSLSNLDLNKQVSVFSETIMNIFENFIMHKTNICNGEDLVRVNKQIKTLAAEKNAVCNRLI